MAEFQEVMRQWKRRYELERKLVDDELIGMDALRFAMDNPEKIESIIMSWAAEHPEPEPILWQDFLLYYYCEYIKKQGNETKTVDEWIARDPIPEDIVQKLEIKKETWNTNA